MQDWIRKELSGAAVVDDDRSQKADCKCDHKQYGERAKDLVLTGRCRQIFPRKWVVHSVQTPQSHRLNSTDGSIVAAWQYTSNRWTSRQTRSSTSARLTSSIARVISIPRGHASV